MKGTTLNFKLVLKIRYSLDGILPTVPFKVYLKKNFKSSGNQFSERLLKLYETTLYVFV